MAQCNRLQSDTTESSNLSRTSKAYADILAGLGSSATQLKIMISFGLEQAFEDGARYQLDRLTREIQAATYPKNWHLIKVPGYSEPYARIAQ